ncbi:MAG: hypothetical protein COA94_04920 [Rickettsiales bacterium]|nr:MAG: hypothetical protein COA94_04920 [Rickettsiales bacterium]
MDKLKKESEAATGCEASAVERLVIPFGAKVHVTQKYRRKITGRKKEYVTQEFTANGIFLGWRTISNGVTYCDHEEGCHWEADKYLQAALVAISPTTNPLYIPVDGIEV